MLYTRTPLLLLQAQASQVNHHHLLLYVQNSLNYRLRRLLNTWHRMERLIHRIHPSNRKFDPSFWLHIQHPLLLIQSAALFLVGRYLCSETANHLIPCLLLYVPFRSSLSSRPASLDIRISSLNDNPLLRKFMIWILHALPL